jgi:uncharacterized membrane protein YcaP (DUF421 family)
MQISILLLRLIMSFVTLLVLTRIMGRKEISQMTFFNFISAISIGTIGASLAIDPSLSIRNGMIALIGWTLFTIVLGFMDLKSIIARKMIVGDPIVVIKKGAILEGSLQKARLDINTLRTLLRKKNTFSLDEVDYAIFETDGTLSVIKKDSQQAVTKSDINLQTTPKQFPISTEVITDGQMNFQNLEKLNLSEEWLMTQLRSSGINSI